MTDEERIQFEAACEKALQATEEIYKELIVNCLNGKSIIDYLTDRK